MPMRIRNFTLKDTADFARLSSQLGYPVGLEEAEIHMTNIVRDPEHSVFVAEIEEGSIQGWIHVFITKRVFAKPCAEIGGLVVDERFRGMGLGGQLLLAAEKWAQGKDCLSMVIRSNVIRGDAHEFYLERGYSLLKQQNVFRKELA